MLTSQLGIKLILLLGKTVPLPAPYNVMAALNRIEVTNDSEQGDGFQISFTIGKDAVVDYGLLASGLVDPFNRVIIGVLMVIQFLSSFPYVIAVTPEADALALAVNNRFWWHALASFGLYWLINASIMAYFCFKHLSHFLRQRRDQVMVRQSEH